MKDKQIIINGGGMSGGLTGGGMGGGYWNEKKGWFYSIFL